MSIQSTFVLLDTFVQPDMNAVAAALRSRHPDKPVAVPGSGTAGTPMILCAGEPVIVMSLPAPLPRDNGVIARASTAWPQVGEAYDRHRAHLIVYPMSKDPSALVAARVVTAVIGAIVATVPGCAGVLWRGEVLRPADVWLRTSQTAFAPYPNYPFMLWIGIHPFRTGSGLGAVTTGLSSLIGREIEFAGSDRDFADAIKKVAGLAVYLIERGTLINDGDTFGASETERMKVSHAISKRIPGLPVLLVETLAVRPG